jgi:membrane protein DedA with SNARE-associated domain
VFQSLVDVVTQSSWVYALILGIAALDAVFPLVPSEATVVAAAALAGAGDLVFLLVLIAGAGGAAIGDNVAYLIGRAGQGRVVGRLLHSPRWRARFDRGERMLRERSATIIVASRFIPGGRTATMLSAGLVGGKAFADEPLHALLLAFGLAAALTLLIEGARRVLRA